MKGVARHLVGTLPNGFLRDGCTSETCSTPHARCPRAAVERRDATTCQVGSRAAARCFFPCSSIGVEGSVLTLASESGAMHHLLK